MFRPHPPRVFKFALHLVNLCCSGRRSMLLTDSELVKCRSRANLKTWHREGVADPSVLTDAELRAEGVDVDAARLSCSRRQDAARAACAALEAEFERAQVDLSTVRPQLGVLRQDGGGNVLQSTGQEVVAAWDQALQLLREGVDRLPAEQRCKLAKNLAERVAVALLCCGIGLAVRAAATC